VLHILLYPYIYGLWSDFFCWKEGIT